ncbi:MAG: cell division protein FtsZ [Lachnoclostridium sp.]|nr:cell division protein FtsZ [Lachnoclostridium sp.]
MDSNNTSHIDNLDNSGDFYTPSPNHRVYIKAIGVGGGGNNAVDHMYKTGIKEVSFVNINTDRQALDYSKVPNRMEIGDGLGAGGDPEVARQYAEDSAEKIATLFDDETQMVFVTAGMGGGTGTGAAPVVARIAKEKGMLTIGIVTIPFLFEGQWKIKQAIAGADEMAKHVDALLVINNERLSEIYGDLDFVNAFGKADDTLTVAARSISEIITTTGHINLDFKDINSTLRNGGAAIISSGYGEGEHRVTKAIQDALNSPLLKNRDINGSKRLLFNLYFSPKAKDTLLISESKEITDFISSINPDVKVIWGMSYDESLGNKVKMTILAAGFDVTIKDNGEGESKPTMQPHPDQPGTIVFSSSTVSQPAESASTQIDDRRIKEEYGDKGENLIGGKERASYIILADNQLDDDAICDIMEKNPTYRRDRKVVEQARLGQLPSSADDKPAGTTEAGSRTFSF